MNPSLPCQKLYTFLPFWCWSIFWLVKTRILGSIGSLMPSGCHDPLVGSLAAEAGNSERACGFICNHETVQFTSSLPQRQDLKTPTFNNPSSNILQRANTPTQKDTDLGSPLQRWMPGSREMRVARLYLVSTSGVILSLHHGHLWRSSATFWGSIGGPG